MFYDFRYLYSVLFMLCVVIIVLVVTFLVKIIELRFSTTVNNIKIILSTAHVVSCKITNMKINISLGALDRTGQDRMSLFTLDNGIAFCKHTYLVVPTGDDSIRITDSISFS